MSYETPPEGDFARYVELLQSQSMAYRSLRESGGNADVLRRLPGMAPPPQRHPLAPSSTAPAPRDPSETPFGRTAAEVASARRPVAGRKGMDALRDSALLRIPVLRAWAAPWLLRLEQAIDAAQIEKQKLDRLRARNKTK